MRVVISCWSSNLSLSLSLSDLASFTSLRCFVSGSTQVRQTKAPKTHRSVSRRMQSSTYSSTAHYISTALHCSTLYILYTLPQTRELKLGRCKPFWKEVAGSTHAHYGHTHTRTHARTHTISHIGGRIQVYAENSSRGNGLVARPCARASSIYAHKDRRGEQ